MEFKNILSVMLSAVLVFSLSGCDNENAKTESGGEQYRQPYVDADKMLWSPSLWDLGAIILGVMYTAV